MPKPTIINARKSVIGNLVFLSGELNINEYAVQSPDDGIDFSDHVSRILDFDFITGSSSVMEQIQVHSELKNQGLERIFNFSHFQSFISESNGSLRGVLGFASSNFEDGTPMTTTVLNGGSGYSDGTHTGQVLTGQDSGANNGRATVTVSGGAVTALVVTTPGNNYHSMEKITVAAPGGGSGAEIVAHQLGSAASMTPFAAQFFPILTGDTTIKIVNFYSDKGDGGLLNDTDESVARTCEFTLIGKR